MAAKEFPSYGCHLAACPKKGIHAPSGGMFCTDCGRLVARDVSRGHDAAQPVRLDAEGT